MFMSAQANCRLFETVSRHARIEVELDGVHWTRSFPSLLEAALSAERLRLIHRGLAYAVATTIANADEYRCKVSERYDTGTLRAAGFSAVMLLDRPFAAALAQPA